MDYRSDPLWQRIVDFSFDDDKNAVVTFSKKLAHTQKWPQEFAERAVYEYRKFIYLCCVSSSGASPSEIVDEVWHLHLTYTVNYWKTLCEETLGKEIHHNPSRGGRWEKEKHDKWYRNSLQLYRDTFFEDPPPDIWPIPEEQVDPAEVFDEGPNFFEPGNRARYVLLLAPFIAVSLLYDNAYPYSLTGKHFLVFYTWLGVIVTIVLALAMNARRRLLITELEKLNRSIPNLELLINSRGSYCRYLLNETLEDRVLIQQEGEPEGYFDLDRALLERYSHPIAPYLLESSETQIGIYSFEESAYAYIEKLEQPVKALRNVCDNWGNYIVMPLLFIAIGAARCAQGVYNDKPIVFLVLLLILFSVLFVIMIMANNFDNITFLYFDKARKEVNNEQEKPGRAFLTAGALGITALWMFDSVQARPTGKFGDSNGSSGSSCGGGGCSGGGGCGGGCGGCGGGGD